MSIARYHAEWLSLVEVSGPFLSMPVLLRVFDAHDPEVSKAVRRALEEWQDNQQGLRPDPAIHTAWVRFVLREVLGFPHELLATGPAIPETLKATVAEHGATLRPDMVIARIEVPVLTQSRQEAEAQSEEKIKSSAPLSLGDFALKPETSASLPLGACALNHPRLLVQIVPPAQDLDKPLKDHRWKASPATRMAELLRGTGVRLGLLTNGERWMLVHAQPGETAGFSSWYASLWLDEPVTLRAFRSLLGVARFYGVADPDTLELLLTESASNQQEVTDQLGYQVREAVEVLVQTFDRIDKDQGRALLQGVRESMLYEAALTVMMRLVFLFSAEERGLLLLGKPMYDQHYAISTLRAQLRAAADETGEEVLERRHDAWSRLLATFRAVFGGVQHEDLRLPAYGGHLFDPERFPFLEGRPEVLTQRRKAAESQSEETIKSSASLPLRAFALESSASLPLRAFALESSASLPLRAFALKNARPIPVDNRTVLHLLEALQVLRVSVPGGGPAEPRRLSFRALDIEQIGHVYEGMLDHTAKRAAEPVLGLVGSKDREPEIPLAQLESFLTQSRKAAEPDALTQRGKEAKPQSEETIKNSAPLPLRAFALKTEPPAPLRLSDFALKNLIDFLHEETGRSASALEKALVVALESHDLDILRAACDNDDALVARVRPFAGLLRRDTFGRPVVITTGSVYVTAGTDRRSSGTHYTPRSLTEPIVQHTLDPLVYHGPAEGLPKEQWTLHPAERILALQVCDMAMGSGAFLVQTCRYLSERLVEAWEQEEALTQDALTQRRKEAKPQSEEIIETFASLPLRDFALESSASLPLRDFALKTDPDERLAHARRLIADRCLYGVDKNPLAVEMAKLSLWLITLQKDRPFSFLDHALRAGDSLLGLAHIDQLLHWSLARDTGPITATFLTEPLRRAIQRAMSLRRRIRETPVRDVRDAERKAGWLHEAEDALGLVRLAADLLVSAALHPEKKRRAELSDEFQYRISLAAEAWESVQVNPTLRPDANREELATLRREADALLAGRQPFHWPLEFPEVFLEEVQPVDVGGQQAMAGFGEVLGPLFGALEVQSLDQGGMGFAAIVGNPPFMKGSFISGSLGNIYRDYLVEIIANAKRGNADLCAYFFLRMSTTLRNFGNSGLLATNTIAQGDTREVGLDQIIGNGLSISRAFPSRPWPGDAAIEVATIWIWRNVWQGSYLLDDIPVAGITSFLNPLSKVVGKPQILLLNSGKAFTGSKIYGDGFLLSPEEALFLIEKDIRNRDVLFPYLGGEDFNSQPDQMPTRWVINFHDWDEERAKKYPECYSIVYEKVRPTRASNSNRATREYWWQYERRRPELYLTISQMEWVLFHSFTSKYLCFGFARTGMIYAGPHNIIALQERASFVVLQSCFHEAWVLEYCSTMRTDIRYAASDVFETFPFPACLQSEHSTQSRKAAEPQSEEDIKNSAPLPLRVFALNPSAPPDDSTQSRKAAEPQSEQKDSAPLPLRAFALKLESIGEAYHTHRQQIMRNRQEGLTKTYNRFHAPGETADDIAELRRLHVEMDNAVATAYGWQDLDLGHGFHQTKQGLRYTISEAARRTVLDRLLALNHARYAEEVEEGLHDKGAKKVTGKGGKGKKASEGQGELF